jgi:hypothetical protein
VPAARSPSNDATLPISMEGTWYVVQHYVTSVTPFRGCVCCSSCCSVSVHLVAVSAARSPSNDAMLSISLEVTWYVVQHYVALLVLRLSASTISLHFILCMQCNNTASVAVSIHSDADVAASGTQISRLIRMQIPRSIMCNVTIQLLLRS